MERKYYQDNGLRQIGIYMENDMDKIERNLIINIVWKPFFAAIMTTVLIMKTELPALLIGIMLGLASSFACYLDLKKYIKKRDNSDIHE